VTADALRAWQELGRTAGVALALAGLGEAAAAAGEAGRAGRLLGAAQPLLPARDPLMSVTVAYDIPALQARSRSAVEPAAFDEALAEGRALTLDQAVAEGLSSPRGGRAGRGLSNEPWWLVPGRHEGVHSPT
jgi:hypothetical protein